MLFFAASPSKNLSTCVLFESIFPIFVHIHSNQRNRAHPLSNGQFSALTLLDSAVAFDTADHFLHTWYFTCLLEHQVLLFLLLQWSLSLSLLYGLFLFPLVSYVGEPQDSDPGHLPFSIYTHSFDDLILSRGFKCHLYTVMIPKGHPQSRIPSRTQISNCLLTISGRMSNGHLSWPWPNWTPNLLHLSTPSPVHVNPILPLAQLRNFQFILCSLFSLTPSDSTFKIYTDLKVNEHT